MGIIRRPTLPAKLEDADTPVENELICVAEKSEDGNTIEIVCATEDFFETTQPEVKAELKSKPRAVITSSATGELFGNWVPSLQSTGVIDISIRNAFYTKVGQLVTCTFDIIITNMYGGRKESSIMLGGLPVTSIGPPNSIAGSAYISYFKTSNLDVRWISGTIKGSDSRIELLCEKRGPGGIVQLTQLDVNVNTVLVGTVTYITNS